MSLSRKLSGPSVLLEDRLSPGADAFIYHTPHAVICCTRAREVDRAFADIEDGLKAGYHAAGLLSYELGYALEPKLSPRLAAEGDSPLLRFGLFGAPDRISAVELDAFFADLGPPPPIETVCYGDDATMHAQKLRAILDLIESGDIYQANLTFPISFSYAGDKLRLYGALRCRQPVSFGGIASFGGTDVLSVSPELWFEVKGNQATTRPMKGTSRRGVDPREDAALRLALAGDPKQLAENLMIVDLLRNDLSRISEFGTVRVPSLFEVETYPGFLAMSSTVTSILRPRSSPRDMIAALFPCGSIVGAPKIRAAEILRDIETGPRGFYTGALGAIAPNRDMRFNVAIRTAVLNRDGSGSYGVGGGIVAESRAGEEYAEALLKARVLTGLAEPYDLIETFRFSQHAGFVRLAHHLNRLSNSARQLGFALDRGTLEIALADKAKTEWAEQKQDKRVRVALSRDGRTHITGTNLPPAGTDHLRVCIVQTRLDPGNPFLRHKTSARETYETAFAQAVHAGLDEALFLNTRGEVSEASRNTVFAAIDGTLFTPPLSSGVLPGVLRQTLLESGEASERVLQPADLLGTWFVGNSLHGMRKATLQEGLLF